MGQKISCCTLWTFDFFSPLSSSSVVQCIAVYFYEGYICDNLAEALHEKFFLLLLFVKEKSAKFRILVQCVFSPQNIADTSPFSSGFIHVMKTEASLNCFLFRLPFISYSTFLYIIKIICPFVSRNGFYFNNFSQNRILWLFIDSGLIFFFKS